MGVCSSRPATATQPLRQETPEEIQNRIIEQMPVVPELLTPGPLQYILRKVSEGICRENFLRWGMRNRQNPLRFLYDPDQTLTRKVIDVLSATGMVPALTLINETEFKIVRRNITPGVHLMRYPMTSIQIAIDFVRNHNFFYFAYPLETGTAGHAVLFKKINPSTIELIDPNAEDVMRMYDSMPPNLAEFTGRIFTRAGILHTENSTCRFQTERGTCALWTILFGIYGDKRPEEIDGMVDAAIRKIGLPLKSQDVPSVLSYDMFIMELFYEFIQRPVLATSVPADYREGFGRRKKKGGNVPEELNILQQIAKQSYNLVDPQEDINGWELKKWTPTMKFYVKGNEVIIGVRGTKTNAPDGNFDVSADLTIPFNGIPETTRYKRDKAAVQQFQQQFPPSQFSYYAVGHSLGGAIIDSLIRDRLIKEAVSYNPAIQYNDINRGLPNRRIYYGSDPLYRLMGWWDVKSEHREPPNRTWADFLGAVSLPAAAVAALPAHNLSNFEGGKKGKLGKKVVFT